MSEGAKLLVEFPVSEILKANNPRHDKSILPGQSVLRLIDTSV